MISAVLHASLMPLLLENKGLKPSTPRNLCDHLLLSDVSSDEMESPLPLSPCRLPRIGRGEDPSWGGEVSAGGNPGYRTQDCHSPTGNFLGLEMLTNLQSKQNCWTSKECFAGRTLTIQGGNSDKERQIYRVTTFVEICGQLNELK